jgi:hypothetical protein
MPILVKRIRTSVLIGLAFWGLINSWEGAALSMFIHGPNQQRDAWFYHAVYGTVIYVSVLSLLSSRLAAAIASIATLLSAAIVWHTDGFGRGPVVLRAWLWTIALRPGLAAVVLWAIPPGGFCRKRFSLGKSLGKKPT